MTLFKGLAIIEEERVHPAFTKTAIQYLDAGAIEYVNLQDLSSPEGRSKAVRVLRNAIAMLEEARSRPDNEMRRRFDVPFTDDHLVLLNELKSTAAQLSDSKDGAVQGPGCSPYVKIFRSFWPRTCDWERPVVCCVAEPLDDVSEKHELALQTSYLSRTMVPGSILSAMIC